MKFFIIRHGKTELNKLGKFNGQTIEDPLSADGIEQVKDAIATIPDAVEHVYASDLTRTRQTAEILNGRLRRDIELVADLREVHTGSLTGKSFSEMDECTGQDISMAYQEQRYDFRPWGGESISDVTDRLSLFVDKVKSEGKHETVLLVTHGGIIRAFHYAYKGQLIGVIKNLDLYEFEI